MSEKRGDYKVAPEAQRAIIAQKLTLWQNTAFDAELDAKVAQVLGDEEMKALAARRLKDALKAQAVLTEMLGLVEDVR